MTLFINAIRSFGSTKNDKVQKILTDFLWYKPIHKFLFKTDELSTFLVASSSTRFILQFITIASGVLIFKELKEAVLLLIGVWLITEFIPRILGISFSKKALKISSGFASFFLLAALPFNIILLNFPKKLLKPIFERENPETDLTDVLEDVKRKASLDSQNKKLIEAVVSFKDRITREVMVPRIQVFSLPDTLTIIEAAELLFKEGYSRVPVYKNTIDSIIGVLMYKDILHLFLNCIKGEKNIDSLKTPISSLVKPVIYTPETKKVSHLLQDFKNKQMHLAIVVDEYGGTEGIVTIEDIIEEIVGDISDEYDIEEDQLFIEQPTGGWIVDAKMSILDIEEHFGILIPVEGDFDTIGGFIFQLSGTIPKKGFHIYLDDFEIEVLNATERAIGKVRITLTNNQKNLTTKEKDT